MILLKARAVPADAPDAGLWGGNFAGDSRLMLMMLGVWCDTVLGKLKVWGLRFRDSRVWGLRVGWDGPKSFSTLPIVNSTKGGEVGS